MDWLDLLRTVIEVCVFPLLAILTKYLTDWISQKIATLRKTSQNELIDKYLLRLDKLISDCVNATTQAYVDSLKKQDIFDAEAQKQALSMTYDAVKTLITDEAAAVLSDALGDIDEYILQKIETTVKENK